MTEREAIVFDTLYERRSIRSFVADKKVEDEKIIKLLKAAMAAPSACNIQPWEFVVVTEESMVKEIKDSIEKYGNYNAPLMIVVCGNPKFIPWENDTGIADCCAAIENMLIAATAMDLGSVWIGGSNPDSVRKILNIPEEVYPIGIAYFGYPAVKPEPRTQYVEDVVFWQKYDRSRVKHKRPNSIL